MEKNPQTNHKRQEGRENHKESHCRRVFLCAIRDVQGIANVRESAEIISLGHRKPSSVTGKPSQFSA